MNKKKSEKKTEKKAKSLVSQFEVRTGLNGKVCDFGKRYTDIIVMDMFSGQTLAWSIKEAKQKMGLSKFESNAKVVPYLINELLIALQETDFDKIKKVKK